MIFLAGFPISLWVAASITPQSGFPVSFNPIGISPWVVSTGTYLGGFTMSSKVWNFPMGSFPANTEDVALH